MFKGARNFVVEGGSFVVNVDSSKKVDIHQLFQMVAPNAILNAGGRADEVRCYPGTREEVISKVEKWMNGVKDGSCRNRIMWLSGPAGAGKSAICHTVAEGCPARGQQAANFFFFRGDQTRNHAQPFVPTLVYQLRDYYQKLDEVLTKCLDARPLIYNATIVDQFQHLISWPMQTLQQSSSGHETIVLIVDGLDECDDSRKQDEILTALRALVDADNSPFLALVASRAEPHLIMSFNRLKASVESIFLDDDYRPRDDIRRFVAAKFDEIKLLHHLRQLLRADWPAESDIDAITDKSSGQFLYAATVMRFIEYSPDSPSLSLVVILEMQPSLGYNPLAQLDAVYSHIFSHVHNIQLAKFILGAYFVIDLEHRTYTTLQQESDYQELLQLVGYGVVEVKSVFANLGAIIQVTADPLNLIFYHASLPDYLKDKARSGGYHVDAEQYAAEVSAICFRNFHDQGTLHFVFRIQPLAHVNTATSELSKSLLDASTRVIRPLNTREIVYWDVFLRAVENLYFSTDRKMFKRILRAWVRFLDLNNLEKKKTDIRVLGSAASRYYKWYLLTEALKFKLKRKLAMGQ